MVIYAGSLVNPVLLGLCRADCRIYNSAEMILEQVFEVFQAAERDGKRTVRLHTGDPSIYGASGSRWICCGRRTSPLT